MTKRELVMDVAARLGYTQHEVSAIVQSMLDSIVDSLAEGHRLEIRNFGVFDVKTRDPRLGRNPRTGDEVSIPQKKIAGFKPGKALKEWIQTGVKPLDDGEPNAVVRAMDPKTPSGLEPRATRPLDDAPDPDQQVRF